MQAQAGLRSAAAWLHPATEAGHLIGISLRPPTHCQPLQERRPSSTLDAEFCAFASLLPASAPATT